MSFQIIGIGEVVWDVFPSHRLLGGAPYNFAFHCRQLSAQAAIVSGIGNDEPGQAIQAATTAAGMDISLLQKKSAFPTAALKIFDINLRQDFYSEAIIKESLALANILKISDEELPVVADLFALDGSVEDQLAQLLDRFELKLIAYTRGPDGSLLMSATEISDHPGHPCVVVSTVGAGDSFTAAFCMGLLHGWPLDEVNDYANQVAAFVCSQQGATPVLPEKIIKKKMYA